MRRNARSRSTGIGEPNSYFLLLLVIEVFACFRYPVFIDAVIQSNGAGFVGTHGSTMTTVALRRVESWHNGPTRVVRWGWPGADDH
jgi:hypothetical protein